MGTLSYSVALELQHQLVQKTLENPKLITILGVEHPSVITLGKRAKAEEEIKVPMEALDDLNIQYYKVDRGGQATLHSPGQLVIYPILKLSENNLSVRDYLCVLQKTTVQFFSEFGVKTYPKEQNPGIFSENGKIAFFGIRVQRGVAFHGLSINVSNEIEDFSLIKSCGTQSEKFDRLINYGVKMPVDQIYRIWTEIFLRNVTA